MLIHNRSCMITSGNKLRRHPAGPHAFTHVGVARVGGAYLQVKVLILGGLLSENVSTQPGQLTSINKKGISIIQWWMFGNMCKYKEGVDVATARTQ